jgi:hypothetical protein
VPEHAPASLREDDRCVEQRRCADVAISQSIGEFTESQQQGQRLGHAVAPQQSVDPPLTLHPARASPARERQLAPLVEERDGAALALRRAVDDRLALLPVVAMRPP